MGLARDWRDDAIPPAQKFTSPRTNAGLSPNNAGGYFFLAGFFAAVFAFAAGFLALAAVLRAAGFLAIEGPQV